MIRANRENREWENEAWDKQTDKAGESREQAQEDPIQKRENGQTDITGKNGNHIELISIIGEIEGHENLSGNTKTTKYEHILPKLAEIEESGETEGVLVLINTVGGDVSCGLALAEMIASLSKSDRFTGHRGQPFDRCAARSGGRSLFYCPDRDDDGTSGTDDGDGDRCRADV